jgi:hypothetical protein
VRPRARKAGALAGASRSLASCLGRAHLWRPVTSGSRAPTRARARRRETRRPALEEHQKACQRWRKENTRRYALQT